MPQELLDGVRRHHFEGLKLDDQCLLLTRALYGRPRNLGPLWFLDPKTVRDRLSRLAFALCVPCGLEPEAGTLGFWVAVHMQCCLVEGLACLERDELFPAAGSA